MDGTVSAYSCKTSCSSDSDCASGYYCRSSTSICVDGNEGSDCDDTNDCDGWCYTGTTVSSLTDTCVASNHCASSTIGTYGTVGNVVCAGNDVWKCYGETGGTSAEGWGLYSDCTNNQCYDDCSGSEGSGTAACTYQPNGADPAGNCNPSTKVCDADNCGWTRTNDGACSGTGNTCGSDSGNTASYKVCGTAGADTDASSTSTSCDGSVDYYASNYACTYSRRYAECNGAGSCDTNSATYYQGTTINTPASKVSKSQSGGSSTPYEDATASNKCGITDVCSDNACSGTQRFLECGGSGSCSTSYYTSNTVYATPNHVLNTACGNDAASTSNYCSYSETCDNGDCSANKYYYGCVGASASCGGSSPYTVAVYPNTGYTLTSTCGTTGTTYCGNSGYNGCTGSGSPYRCQRKYDQYRCGATHTCNYDTGTDGTSNIATGNVCTGSGTQTAGSTTYYSSSAYTSCSGSGSPYSCQRLQTRYSCDGSGGTQGTNEGTVTYNIGTGNVCTGSGTQTAGSTTYYSSSAYTSCSGAGTSATCQRDQTRYSCDGSGGTQGTNEGTVSYNIANGYVCTGSGSQTLGSSTHYAFSDTSDRCSGTGISDGFGDRVYDVFACNGNNAQGGDVGDKTIDCGTGCCYDAGSTTSCISSGAETTNFYDFGSGDTATADYCTSATVVDCNSASGCESGYSCTYNNCIDNNGKLIVKDSSSNDLAYIDSSGKVLLKGSLYQSTATSPPANSFQIKQGGSSWAWIDSSGNLYLKGTASQKQGSLSPSGGNDWRIQNSGSNDVLFIDGATGNLLTLSTIVENVIS